MKIFLLLISVLFASENENDAKNDPKYEENSIVVKIEEDEYAKVNKQSEYIGVSYDKKMSKWSVRRWNKDEKKVVYSGLYDDEETAAHASDTLARKVMENGEHKLKLNFPDDYTEFYSEKQTSSNYIGVSYNKNRSKWCVQRWSKNEDKLISNGHYHDEEIAAHASDTLARKLMNNGERGHKLNFPDDHIEVYPEKDKSSKYIGVSYCENKSKWFVQRWCKDEKKAVSNGLYDDEETAAHASDTLARKLMANGEQDHKLNFPDDDTEIFPEKKTTTSKYIGVSYHTTNSSWRATRWSKNENKTFFNGYYENEETAAHASDSLARKFMESGEQKIKLNFPDDRTEVYPEENQKKKRKRAKNISLKHSQNN